MSEENNKPRPPKTDKGNPQEPEDLKSEQVKPGKSIPITENEKDKDETVKVNFMDKNFIKDYVGKKTVKSDEPTPGGEDKSDNKSSDSKETTDDLRERIKRDENAYEKQFTPEDFEEIAGFVIDIVDAGISTALRVWAKDTSSRNYELEKSKKDKLAKQGKLILVKHKLKWSVEFVFVLSLVIFYAGPIQKARKRRSVLESTKSGSSDSKQTNKTGVDNKDESDKSTKQPPGHRKPPKRPHSQPK